MSKTRQWSLIVITWLGMVLLVSAAPLMAANGFGFAINPSIAAGQSDLPNVREIISIYNYYSVSSGGTPATRLDLYGEWGFVDIAPFDLIMFSFNFSQVSVESSWDLGLGDVSDYNLLFEPYFEAHPDAAWAWAYHTSGGATPPSLVASTSTTNTLPRDLFPYDTFEDIVPFDSFILGYPNIGDGIVGWSFIGTVVSGATVNTGLSCQPSFGTLPFSCQMAVSLENLYNDQTRRIAGQINVSLASGNQFNNWRGGWTNIAASSSFSTSWNQSFPNLNSVTGQNLFELLAADVTPAPYNQPPYPPAGDTDTDSCTVTGIAP